MSFIEKDSCRLPESFQIVVPDDQFQWLMRNASVPMFTEWLKTSFKRATLDINGFFVTIRSELDPDDWAPMLRSEALH